MFELGIDENGLGPLLGPLVVTGVLAQCEHARAVKKANSAPGSSIAQEIGDSKALVAFGDSHLGEAWARVLYEEETGRAAKDPGTLIDSLNLQSVALRHSLCPGTLQGAPAPAVVACWGATEGVFEASDTLVESVRKTRARLKKAGFQALRPRLEVVCVKELNRAHAGGVSRLLVDLHKMENLILDAWQHSRTEIHATCGKVGGYDRYGEHFGPLSNYLQTPLVEGRAESSYRIAPIGTVRFVRDADANHMLVSLASLIGKWTRDFLMQRIGRYYQEHVPKAPLASGYHDPITMKLVKLTKRWRVSQSIPDECFMRFGKKQ